MPPRAKGPRLALRKESVRDDDGTSHVEFFWIVRDGQTYRRTGCREVDRRGAETFLAAYLAEKYQPRAREGDLASLTVAEVMTAYAREHAPETRGKTPVTIGYNIAALLPFWGSRTLADVRKTTCQEYARSRPVSVATVRRELSVLSAAINHWNAQHGPLNALPVVTLPEKPAARDRWINRGEAAMLLAGALGFYRVFWSDVATRRRHVRWERHRWAVNRHAARFILLGLHTGTRSGAIAGLRWLPNLEAGWIDLDGGVLHRRGRGETETNKRRPPVKLGRKLIGHLRRWKRIDDRARDALREKAIADGADPAPAASRFLHVVAYEGYGVEKIRRAWATAVDLAWLAPAHTGQDAVTPHVLRHTRATWLMQAGIDHWEAAGALGMSVKTLIDNYAHHHPDWQKNAAEI